MVIIVNAVINRISVAAATVGGHSYAGQVLEFVVAFNKDEPRNYYNYANGILAVVRC